MKKQEEAPMKRIHFQTAEAANARARWLVPPSELDTKRIELTIFGCTILLTRDEAAQVRAVLDVALDSTNGF